MDIRSSYSLDCLLRNSREREAAGERFEPASERMLRIDVDGGVWLKPGAAIAYRGDLHFERLPTIEASSITAAALREMSPLVRAAGYGRLYCGHAGSHVRVVRLSGESIVVSWQDLLAFEESLHFELALLAHGVSIAAGGLVVVKLSGNGMLAMATHGEPLMLQVAPGSAVSTDPHGTVAWSGNLTPSLKTDLSWRSIFGHGGQEPIQLFFEGEGFVLVQPYQDRSNIALGGDLLRQLKSLIV